MIFGGFQLKDIFSRFRKNTSPGAYYLTLCCIVKDENEYLEEWIRYHLKIGVGHFYIYDNESKIEVADTLKNLGLLKFVTVINVFGKAKQVVAYNDCLSRWRQSSRWIGFIDADEFIVPKSTNGNLPAFLKDFEEFGGLAINWMVFGSGGHLKRTGRSQLKSFTMRSETDFHVNRHVKVIVQTRHVKRSVGAHLFRFKNPYYAVNEKRIKVDSSYSDVSTDNIQINHYYCRSLEEYQDKVNRGLADSSRGKRSMEHFHHHDSESNKVEDKTILSIVEKS